MHLSNKIKILLYVALAAILYLAGYFIYQYFHPGHPITAESQVQAETPQGVELAARNNQVTMLQSQLDEAAKQIAELKNRKPDTIIKTVPTEVIKVVTQEVDKRGADFAIVTDPKNPTKEVDLKEVASLPTDTPVTLNEYNVFAYKKVTHDVTVYPSFSGITPNGVGDVEYGVNRKVTKKGTYVRVAAGYDFQDKEAKIGVGVAW